MDQKFSAHCPQVNQPNARNAGQGDGTRASRPEIGARDTRRDGQAAGGASKWLDGACAKNLPEPAAGPSGPSGGPPSLAHARNAGGREASASATKSLTDDSDRFLNSGPGATCLPYAAPCGSVSDFDTKSKRGGYRRGAGRKPNAPSALRQTGPRWYVVEAKPRELNLANGEIKQRGYETFLPMMLVNDLQRRDTISIRPRFFQFFFTRFNPTRDAWEEIRYARGVARILPYSFHPSPVPAGEIERLIETMPPLLSLDAAALDSLPCGRHVRIVGGPFSNHCGIVIACDGLATTVKIELFNRPSNVLLPRADVMAS